MEKRKNDHLLPGWGLKHILLLIIGLLSMGLVLGICFLCAIFVSVYIPGECLMISNCPYTAPVVPRQLPVNLVDSTQHLLDYPILLPNYLEGLPDALYDGEIAIICVIVDRVQFVTATHRFKINGAYLARENNAIVYKRVEDSTLEICAHVSLDRGLHLIEFDALLYNGYRNGYAWAIEIK